MRRIVVAALAVFMLGLSGIAEAQLSETSRDYYKAWLKTAARAEEAVDNSRASSAAFGKLRSEISEYREIFAVARTKNSERIHTLESQLKALGPKPETGEEPSDIAHLRKILTEQLDVLRVPRIVSEEAYSRANGLITEVDRIIREREAAKLLSRGPSPLNPTYWPDAWTSLERASSGLINETANNLRSDVVRQKIEDQLPMILGLLFAGVVLIFRGRKWSERFGDYLRSFGGAGTGVWSFVVSLTRILLPFIGTMLLVQAVSLAGFLGLRGQLVLQGIPAWAAIFLVFNWIGRQIFLLRRQEELQVLASMRIAELRLLIDLLSTMLILHGLVQLLGTVENISEATRAVIGFPVVCVTALILLRMQRLRSTDAGQDALTGGREKSPQGFSRLIELIRRALYLLGLIAPILAAAGYVHGAEALIYPAVTSLALIAIMIILQRFLVNLYVWISRSGDTARDSLFTVLIGFALALLSLPILALLWGARGEVMTELWSKLLEGFQIGGTRISPTIFLTFAALFMFGYTLTRLLQGGLRNSLLPKTSIDPGGQNAIVAGTGYVGIFLAALVAVTGAGLDLSSLAIVAGALSVGIGFGLQTIVSNFVSGIILLVERPISKGDWIDVGGRMGYVRDISVRATRIETFDRTDVIVPNSDLISGSVVNYTRGNTVGRVIVPVGVAYGTDTRLVEKILGEVANSHPMVLANPAPSVVFQGFGADSLDFEIRAILRDVNWVLSVKSDMNHEIAKRFTEAGLEIPFAQRDIWLRNPEALAGGGVPSEKTETTNLVGEPIEMTEADLSVEAPDEH